MPESLEEVVEYINDVFGWVRDNFGTDLNKGFGKDDWTLIVRLHAIIETVLNTARIEEFNAPELERVIAKLDTSNPATGKVAFAKALGVITHDASAFLQQLSELRNFCVHDIKNFDLDLVKHIDGLPSHKRAAFKKALTRLLEHGAILSPQGGLVGGVMCLLMQLHLHHERCRHRDTRLELLHTKARLFYEQDQSTSKR